MRLARLLAPGRFRQTARSNQNSFGINVPFGTLAGNTNLATNIVKELFDRNSIIVIVILFFVDPSRLHIQRLQVIKISIFFAFNFSFCF